MIKTYISAALLIISPLSYSQQKLSLEDAVSIALKNNYSITIARQEQQIFENNVSLGNAGFLPEVNGTGSYTEEIESSKQSFQSNVNGTPIDVNNAKSNSLNAGVALNWTIFDGLRMFVNLDRFKQQRDINQTELRAQVEDLIFNVYSGYYTLVREQRVLSVMSKNLALSKERMDITQAAKDLGSASKFDLLQANVDFNEDKSNYLREEQRISQLLNNFNRLLNIENTDYVLSDTIPLPVKLAYEDIERHALESNSDIQLANKRFELAGLDVRLAASDWFPNISLGAGYNFFKSENEAGSIRMNKTYGWNYGVRVSLNIFDGFNTLRQSQNAAVNRDIAELEIKNIKQQVYSELNNAYKRYTSGLELAQLERDNLNAASQNSDIAIERLRLGEISALEFRNIQRNLLDAESRLYAALLDLKLSEIDLLRISGKLVSNI